MTGDERLEEIKNLNGTTPLSDFQYTAYNPVNASATIATWQQQSDSNAALAWTEGYDSADQLTGAVEKNSSTQALVNNDGYQYDNSGNRTQEQTVNYVTTGTFNSLNQPNSSGLSTSNATTTFSGSLNESSTLTVNGNPVTVDGNHNFSATLTLPTGSNTVTMVAKDSAGNQRTNHYQLTVANTTSIPTFDADGNELTNGNGESYTWDARNELVAIVYTAGSNSGNHTEFTYDALGHRIAIVERTGTTIGSGTVNSTKQLVWDGSMPVEERNVGNQVTKRFYSLGEQIGGTNYYYTKDHLGSVREMTNSSGTIVARYDYDPYGRVTPIGTITVPSDLQYAGYYEHVTSGLNLTMFRAYDPNASRWLSRDPQGEAVGVNLYAYAYNNPIRFIDPLGLCPCNMQNLVQANTDTTMEYTVLGLIVGAGGGGYVAGGYGMAGGGALGMTGGFAYGSGYLACITNNPALAPQPIEKLIPDLAQEVYKYVLFEL